MLRYIPDFIAERYRSGDTAGSFSGFSLLADIADFTETVTRLQALGKQGAEDMSELLNGVFAEAISTVESFGGFVSVFAGDAFCAIFPSSDGAGAVNAARALIGSFSQRPPLHTAAGDIFVKLRLAVHYGDIRWEIFSNPLQHEYAFTGEGVAGLGGLSALRFDTAFSPEAARQAGLELFVPLEGAFELKPAEVVSPPARDAVQHHPPHGFLNSRLSNERPANEFRSGAFCFASLQGIPSPQRGEAVETLARLADASGGYMNKLDATDKGLLAIVLFGLPRTSGTTLEQICKFSLDLVSQLPQIAVGISYGQVFSGVVGGTSSREYTAIGHPLNLAARLMSRARPGEVLADASFWQELYRKYSFVYQGMLNLKGIAQPVRFYRLSEKAEGVQSWQETPFSGRESEISSIRDWMSALISSKGRGIMYLLGEPGIGKSRLAREALSPWNSPAQHLFHVGCDTFARNPLDAFRQIARALFYYNPQLPREASVAMFRGLWPVFAKGDPEMLRIESLIASLLDLSWENSVWSMLPQEERAEQVDNAVITLLQNLAGEKPLILFLDDGQWLDAASRALLCKIADRRISPLAIVCACRYAEDGGIPDLGLPEYPSASIELGVLSLADCGGIIGSILRLGKVPAETSLQIMQRSMGNPFFIEQLTSYMQENGLLSDKGELTADIGYLSSFSISDIVGARIDRLTDEVRECVCNASVLGAEFNVRVLSRMLNAESLPELGEGEKNRIWQALDELRYMFTHILIRDTVYQRTLGSRLRELHNLAAEALIAVHQDDLEPLAEEIARHFAKAGKEFDAARYYAMAGEHYYARYLLPKAEECYSWVLEYSSRTFGSDHPETATSCGNLANVYLSQSRYEQALELMEKSLRIRRQAFGEEHQDTMSAYNNLGNYYFDRGDFAKAEELYQRSYELRLAAFGEQDAETVKAMHNLANLHFQRGDLDLAENLLVRLTSLQANLFEETHPDRIATLNSLGSLYHQLGRNAEAEKLLLQVCQLRESTLGPDHPDLAASWNNLANLYNDLKDYARAVECNLKSIGIKERTLGASHPDSALSYSNLANVYINLEKFGEAEDLFLKALAVSEKAFGADNHQTAAVLDGLANLYDAQGRFADAEPLFLRAIAANEATHGSSHPITAISVFNLGASYINHDRLAEGEGWVVRAFDAWRQRLGLEHPWTQAALNTLIELYGNLGKPDKAAEYRALLPQESPA